VIRLLLLLGVILGTSSSAWAATLTLAWDQSADPLVGGYRVFVGQASGRYDRSFDVGRSTSFAWPDAAPNVPYYFAVAAYAPDGRTSTLSNEVMGLVPAPSLTVSSRSIPSACGAPGPCFRIRPISTDLLTPTSLAATADGRVILIEEHRRLRVVADGSLSPRAALAVDSAEESLAEVAIDPAFASKGSFYVARLAARRNGAETRITRFQLVEGIAGIPAAAIAPLPASLTAPTPIAVDAAGRVYVAMSDTGTGDPYAATVLRFNADGSVPVENRAASPVIARGLQTPMAIAIDTGGRLWLAGRDADGPVLAELPPDEARGAQWPAVPAAFSLAGAGVADVRGMSVADAIYLLVTGSDGIGRVLHVPLVRGVPGLPAALALDAYGEPVAIAVSPGGNTLYVAVRNPDGTGRYTLLELSQVQPL
jgi:hypothetical protein